MRCCRISDAPSASEQRRIKKAPRINLISANLITASALRMYYVSEGQHDRSLARSAWEIVHRENRPVGYGMIGRI